MYAMFYEKLGRSFLVFYKPNPNLFHFKVLIKVNLLLIRNFEIIEEKEDKVVVYKSVQWRYDHHKSKFQE